jgi:tRNA1(Val) A37 N6-methylase TrmN6
MKKRRATSAKRNRRRKRRPDYVLQGTEFDLPMETVLGFSSKQRKQYINAVLGALAKTIRANKFSLKPNVSFAKEMRDLRRLLYGAADQYLFIDEKTNKRNVLGKGSPGATHTYWSRSQMWKMKTKAGDLSVEIRKKAPALVRKLTQLLDPKTQSKVGFRKQNALRSIYTYLQIDKHSGTAFPPLHAKFFADKFLPKDKAGIIVDPCAGWGGRLLGSLLVNRKHRVHYYGVDPEFRNEEAYEGLKRRVNTWLKRELTGPRDAKLFYKPFEDWINTKSARSLMGKADLVITSPPYFVAENYNPKNQRQSANRYPEYLQWRENFYRVLMKGAYGLLKANGHFVLNIADVSEAPRLERDARKLADETGFVGAGFYKLAMTISPEATNVRHVVIVNGAQFKYEPVFVFRKPAPGSG